MARARNGACAEVVDGALVVAGGVDADGRTLAHVEKLEPATGKWRELPPMPRATYGAASGVLGSRLYVAGGKRCRRLQMWDGARWTLKADLPEQRLHAGAPCTTDA